MALKERQAMTPLEASARRRGKIIAAHMPLTLEMTFIIAISPRLALEDARWGDIMKATTSLCARCS